MRRDVYKGYCINAFATLDDATSKDWVPGAEIYWTEAGEKKSFMLTEPVKRFDTVREAEVFANQMCKAWIRGLFDSAPNKPH
jgi:hypothetical protein